MYLYYFFNLLLNSVGFLQINIQISKMCFLFVVTQLKKYKKI